MVGNLIGLYMLHSEHDRLLGLTLHTLYQCDPTLRFVSKYVKLRVAEADCKSKWVRRSPRLTTCSRPTCRSVVWSGLRDCGVQCASSTSQSANNVPPWIQTWKYYMTPVAPTLSHWQMVIMSHVFGCLTDASRR